MSKQQQVNGKNDAFLYERWLRPAMRALRERTLWLAVVIGLALVALAYQSPRTLYIDVGGPLDDLHTVNFYADEKTENATFRWSGASSALLFSGLGKPLTPLIVELQLMDGRSAEAAPIEVAVSANGHALTPLRLTRQSVSYTLAVDPEWIGPSGDLRLDFTSPTFSPPPDTRELGFIADFARLRLPSGLTMPSITQLLGFMFCSVLLYASLRLVRVTSKASGAVTLLFLAACAAVIAYHRLLLTVFTERLALTLTLGLVVTLAGEAAARWLANLAGWNGTGKDGKEELPEWAWTALRGLLLVTAFVKLGGLLYPHTFIIDAPFHLKYVTYAVEGRPFEEYFGESLSLAVMPKEEWGAARAIIPYSPFFFFAAAPLAKLPWPIAVTVPIACGVLDVLKVAVVFLLGLALGGARGAALRATVAAVIYAFIPATFLLQQWGNWPTQTSLWLLTLWAAIVCLFWSRITKPLVWVTSTLILALTMLSYTVTAAYTGVFVVMLLAGGLIFTPKERGRWVAIGLSLTVAVVVATLIFYGRYIGILINETLPTFSQAVEEQGKLTTLRPTLGGFITDNLARAMQSYNLAIIYALGLAGTLLVGGWGLGVRGWGIEPAPSPQPPTPNRVWLAAWLLTFPIFTMLDFYVDQALKEFWYALPAVAVVSGGWAITLARHRQKAANLFVWLLGATLVWQSLSLWVFRILFHNR